MTAWNYSAPDEGRIKRAKEVKVISSVTTGDCYAVCKGSGGNEYRATLEGCECKDYFVSRKPCKHMIRLAMLAGVINENGETPEQENKRLLVETKIKVALCQGLMSQYGVSIVSTSVISELSNFTCSHSSLSEQAISILNTSLTDFIKDVSNKLKQ